MSKYTLPSGRASIETAGGPMSETEYAYPVAGKDKTIQELLTECWKLNAEVERLKRYECSWTDCGEKKKNKELQAEVDQQTEQHNDLVERNALLRQRPDLPVDRIPAHKRLIELQADVERYRKCLQRIVDEGWDRYGCAKTLEPTEKDDG